MSLSLTQANARLKKYVGPVDSTTDDAFLDALNEVRERFFESGKWKNMVIEVSVTPVAGIVTLPTSCESILGAQFDGAPVIVFSRYHEFTPGGPGEVTAGLGAARGLIDMGGRQYKIMGDSDVTSVRLTCKLRYVPILTPLTGEDDPDVVPDNMGALKLGLMALSFENSNDLERAEEYFTKALSLLNGEVAQARGAAQSLISMSPHGFHTGRPWLMRRVN